MTQPVFETQAELDVLRRDQRLIVGLLRRSRLRLGAGAVELRELSPDPDLERSCREAAQSLFDAHRDHLDALRREERAWNVVRVAHSMTGPAWTADAVASLDAKAQATIAAVDTSTDDANRVNDLRDAVALVLAADRLQSTTAVVEVTAS